MVRVGSCQSVPWAFVMSEIDHVHPTPGDEVPKPPTVGELRQMLADLPDDDLIVVDGYESGYDPPRLMQGRLDLSRRSGYSYSGVWREARRGEQGTLVWVLSRTPDWESE